VRRCARSKNGSRAPDFVCNNLLKNYLRCAELESACDGTRDASERRVGFSFCGPIGDRVRVESTVEQTASSNEI
jgi:hypothetical protein